MASEQGGMNIEEVAKENPDAIIWQPIDIMEGRTTVWVHVHVHAYLYMYEHGCVHVS